MAAIITDQIRLLNAGNFVSGVTSTTNAYYSFIGLPNPTDVDSDWNNDPPAPKDNFSEENDYWDDMVALKKVAASDCRQVVKKRTWSSGTTYDMYRGDYSRSNTAPVSGATNLYASTFYVINSDYRVYICLQNGTDPDNPNGRPSLDEPTFTDLEPSRAGDSGDGYIWKYLYTITPSDIIKFDSTEYITVPNNWSTSTDAQIRAVRESADSSSNENQIKTVYIAAAGDNYANGIGQEFDIIGDGTGAKVRVDVQGNRITNTTVVSGGKDYTYGLVDLGSINSNTTGTSANLVPIIPPSKGHGFDIYTELGTDRVLVYARFDDSTRDFPVDTSFAQVSIVKNPTKVGTNDVYQENTFSGLFSLKLKDDQTLSGKPKVGEKIEQNLSVGKARGWVASWDDETKVLKYFSDRSIYVNQTTLDTQDYAGISTNGRSYDFNAVGGSINGNVSGFQGTIDTAFSGITTNPTGTKLINLGVDFTNGMAVPEINKGSGEIIYLDNRASIARNPRQKEDLKIILEF